MSLLPLGKFLFSCSAWIHLNARIVVLPTPCHVKHLTIIFCEYQAGPTSICLPLSRSRSILSTPAKTRSDRMGHWSRRASRAAASSSNTVKMSCTVNLEDLPNNQKKILVDIPEAVYEEAIQAVLVQLSDEVRSCLSYKHPMCWIIQTRELTVRFLPWSSYFMLVSPLSLPLDPSHTPQHSIMKGL